MYYLRADQRYKVRPLERNLNPQEDRELSVIRFRFPWPDEDSIEPGAFEDPFRKLYLRTMPPDEEGGTAHEQVTFTSPYNHRITVACPYSQKGDAGIPYDERAIKGRMSFDQQALRQGVWVLIGTCGGCGAKYRYPTLESVKPILDELDEMAFTWANRREEEMAVRYRSISDRIILGYTRPENI